MSQCEPVRKQFWMYLYGELSFDEEETVESHLEGCVECQASLEQEREMQAAFTRVQAEPSAALLRSCRQNLAQALAAEAPHAKHSWWAKFVDGFTFRPAPTSAWMRPVGAMALLALGFFGSRLAPLAGGFQSMGMVQPDSTKVRFVEPAADGQVQIVLDETRHRTISGGLDDVNIRALLLEAAREPSDPGLRVDTLTILNSATRSADIRDTLLYALAHDQNAGVRMKALEGLRPFAQDKEVQSALGQVLLTDQNPGLRTQAIDLLTGNADLDRPVIGVIQQLMRSERNDYVRQRGQRLLEAVNASVETY